MSLGRNFETEINNMGRTWEAKPGVATDRNAWSAQAGAFASMGGEKTN